MKVILLTEVKNKGGEGDVVDVAPGFANNYLLPQGMAVLATKGNLKQLEQLGMDGESLFKSWVNGFAYEIGDVKVDGDTAKAESCLASSLSEDAKSMIISSIPQGATVSIEGMDQSMTETTAKVKASLSKGGEQEYTVKFVRSDNHIGWAVSSLDIDLSAADNQ